MVVEWTGSPRDLEAAINAAREKLEHNTTLSYTFVQALPREYDSRSVLLIFNLVR